MHKSDKDDEDAMGLASLAGIIEDDKNQDNPMMPTNDPAEKARWLFRGYRKRTIH